MRSLFVLHSADRLARLLSVAALLATGLPALATGALAQATKVAPAAAKPAPGAVPAQAPPAPAPPAPVGSEPGTTSASYGDWLLRCQRIGEGDKVQRVCEVSQTVQLQNQRDPVAEVALGRLPNEAVLRLTAALPPSVSFPSIVELTSAPTGGQAVQLQWRRCVAGGCFADAQPSDDVMKAWRGVSGAGKLTFKDAGGREISLPISFRGLAQALDALART